MLKKTVSLLLVLMFLLGMTAIAHAEDVTDPTEIFDDDPTEAPTEAEPTEPIPGETAIFFDPEGSGWEDYDTIGFHIWEIDDDTLPGYAWGSDEQKGRHVSDGRWFYDLDEAGMTIRPGKQYGVIFYASKNDEVIAQTYNLIFGAECIGKTAACEGTLYENPENSQKTAQAAFWKDGVDPTVYGPELQISSIGTVVGTCCPASTTPYLMFENFMHNTLQNARIYSGKTDQELLDDIGAALGLTRDEIEEVIIENGFIVEWDIEKSPLPGTDEPTEPDEEPAEESAVKSPKTGYDASVLLVMITVAIAAAGILIARKKIRQ